MDLRTITAWTQGLHSPSTLHEVTKLIDGHPQEDGTWPIFAARVMMFYGLRLRRQFFYEPLSSFDRIRDALYFVAAQQEAFVPKYATDGVMIAFEIFGSARTAPSGRIQDPSPGEASLGLHAVAAIGWDDGGETLVFANSWGRRWGLEGIGFVTREYYERFGSEAWLQRNARFGATRNKWDRLTSAPSMQEWYQAWMLENPRWSRRIRYAGRNYTLVNYVTLSVEEGCPVDIVELRNPNGVRVGWAEVFHLRRASASEATVSKVKELYVWPHFRRRGYGTVIEAAVRLYAELHRSSVVMIDLYEPDASRPALRAAPHRFALSRNYTWRWRRQSHPPRVGHCMTSLDEPVAQVLYPVRGGFRAETSRATSETIR